MSELAKTAKTHKNDLILHKALLLREGATKNEAEVVAYAEGKAGLAARLDGKSKPNEAHR